MKHAITTIICLCIMIVCLSINLVGNAETVIGDLESRLNENTIEYDGQTYRPKKRLTTVLLMGIDQWEYEHEESGTSRSGGQADFQMLVVFDTNEKTISAIHINRDMMTQITILNLLGEVTGSRTAQVCLAYGYGDGAEKSCELTAQALSDCLMDVQIDHYIAVRLDSISAFNDTLGGVEVTLDDDLTMYDPAMKKGATICLNGEQAEYYIRYRYGVGDGSNASRMLRQRNYMQSAINVLNDKLSESAAFAGTLFDAVEPYMVTDMKRGKLINLAGLMTQYSIQGVCEIEGQNIVGNSGYNEFYPDEDSLMQLLLDVFYDQVS